MTRVLITGVRGKTGVPLAGLLTARGVEVRGGSSTPERVDLPGVVPVSFSWDDQEGWAGALLGVDAVQVVRPDRADAPELVGALVDRVSPTTRVVLLSERSADTEGPEGWAMRAEAAVTRHPGDWSVLRPSWFMQVLGDPRFFRDVVVDDRTLPFPTGGAALAWIDARDIAAVAAAALLDEGHARAVHELTGPESLTLEETAAVLSAGLGGSPVQPRDVGVDAGLAGLDGFERELTALTYDRVRAGVFAPVTDTVERVLGRPAGTLRTWVADAGPGLRDA
ncbi:nucleoside-diphosphate sugar epimerase [Phycicoccus sp. CSK15P-2]|uniref:nucleoside-diphosphate sugar epimerase n=1 Tax=Phycicoccus sp. CSK15P-2 TaxID=2807627 RepID=UPI001951C13D|nr:nucleoside-diphosphate sugar epimerase [Phycicoccus sp. CSK15P-2]MBM6403257.1 nucleoside-diphosphate sugar epimerase [Phycicoccus sp. CSK15P-2]